VRRRRDAYPLCPEPARHPVLRRRRPGIVVLAVQDQDRRSGKPGELGGLVGAAQQVFSHHEQALGGVAQHALAQERDDGRWHAIGDGLRLELGLPQLADSLGPARRPGLRELGEHRPRRGSPLAAETAWPGAEQGERADRCRPGEHSLPRDEPAE